MRSIILLLTSLFLISACAKDKMVYKYPKSKEERVYQETGSIIRGGGDGFSLFGGENKKSSDKQVEYLWAAALDVLSFAPITSADINNKVIMTDWYANESGKEQLKFNVIINRLEFGAVNLVVRCFKRQGLNGMTACNKQLEKDLEEKILTRAKKVKRS
jgi:hypothetical protein